MSTEEIFNQIIDKSHLKLSETQIRNLGVYLLSSYVHIPIGNILVRLALYYDTIFIPHPVDLLLPFVRFYRKRGVEFLRDRLAKEYVYIKDWIDNDVVRLLKIDSEWNELLEGTLEGDYTDKNYRSFILKIEKKSSPTYFLKRHLQDVRSKWIRDRVPIEAVDSFYIQANLYQINQALLTSSISGATPLSDSPQINAYLKYKLERAASLNYKLKIPAVLNSVLSIAVPYVDSLNVKEIVEFRRKRKGPLSRFRTRMNELTIRIKSTPWDKQFQAEVEEIIQQEIVPELRDVRKLMRETQPNVKETTIKAVVSQIPYLGSFVDLCDVIQTWRRKRQLEKNSLYFLALL